VDEYLASNRALWDEMTPVNERSAFYHTDTFATNPDEIRLRDYEIEDIGDVRGKSLLHLQCHFGLDTLSWARLGAKVTGADFSKRGLEEARALAARTGIDAEFVWCEDIVKLPEYLDAEAAYDIVYTSGGVLGWLPDLDSWARMAAHFVKPGGVLYVADGHPLLWVYDDDEGVKDLRLRYHYWTRPEPIVIPVKGSYADTSTELRSPLEYGWNHSMGEIVTAVAQAGLHIEFLREMDFVHWPMPFLVEGADGRWRLPPDAGGELPLFFALKATKPAAPAASHS